MTLEYLVKHMIQTLSFDYAEKIMTRDGYAGLLLLRDECGGDIKKIIKELASYNANYRNSLKNKDFTLKLL